MLINLAVVISTIFDLHLKKKQTVENKKNYEHYKKTLSDQSKCKIEKIPKDVIN
jgi:hypothetical protein